MALWSVGKSNRIAGESNQALCKLAVKIFERIIFVHVQYIFWGIKTMAIMFIGTFMY